MEQKEKLADRRGRKWRRSERNETSGIEDDGTQGEDTRPTKNVNSIWKIV